MEEKESKNENTTTLDALDNSKREDEDATLTAQNNAEKDSHGVKAVSLGKSLLGDNNTLKKGISVSVRGRNAGAGLNLKNGGSVWKNKDEKGQENQKEVGKKIDEESFPDLLESTEKIKSELSKDKDKKKKGGKELKKLDDGPLRYGSERGKGESANGEKRRPFGNNLDISQNNDSGLKNWSDQANENEADDIKENEQVAEDKQDAEVVGYLMPGFKGKHMIGFHCFLKKGSHNPPPIPPSVPFDDTSFFEIIEKQKSVVTKPMMHNMSATQQMSQLGHGNQTMQVMQTNPLINMHPTNFLNSNAGVDGDNNLNQMTEVNKINSFNANDKMMREQPEGAYNRFMQTPQTSGLSRGNLNMFNEKVNNANTSNINSSISNNTGGNRSSTFYNRGGRSFGQNNVNYNANNMDGMVKNNMHNNVNNYNKTNNSVGSMSAGGTMRPRNFNRRYERRDERKVKISDIDADTNWRSPLNKKVNEEKINDGGNDTWNGNGDNSNINNNNYTNDGGNIYSTASTNNNNNNNNNNSNGGDRMKRNFRNRNTNTLSNMDSTGSANSFNRSNFSGSRNYANRNNMVNMNVNNINRNNANRNTNMNNNFMNNNMNMARNNMNRGNGNRKNAVNLNNNNNSNNHYNNVGANKMMNRNIIKRNSGNMHNFGSNGNGSSVGVVANNLFNRLSGNNIETVAPTTSATSSTLPNDMKAPDIEHGNNMDMSNESAAVTNTADDLNTEMGNN